MVEEREVAGSCTELIERLAPDIYELQLIIIGWSELRRSLLLDFVNAKVSVAPLLLVADSSDKAADVKEHVCLLEELAVKRVKIVHFGHDVDKCECQNA